MNDMKLSEHFTLFEGTLSNTAIRNRIDNTPPQDVIPNMVRAAEQMERVRSLLGDNPITVDSWYRCDALNIVLPGSRDPRGHMSGWCVDFLCWKFGSPLQVCRKIIANGSIKFDQLIWEGGWTHISFHPAMRGEILTAKFGPGGPVYTTGIAGEV